MTDRGIIFSGSMVNAIGEGRKTQTRRLATSPLRRCVPGDRLWVRETCRAEELENGRDGVRFMADKGWRIIQDTPEGAEAWVKLNHYHKKRGAQVPAIHMPRWASRLTLIVETVKVEPLQSISWDDARAEGLLGLSKDGKLVKYGLVDRDGLPGNDDFGWHWKDWDVDPTAAYRRLWSMLHTDEGERWEDNPDVVALSFRIVVGNIDQVPA